MLIERQLCQYSQKRIAIKPSHISRRVAVTLGTTFYDLVPPIVPLLVKCQRLDSTRSRSTVPHRLDDASAEVADGCATIGGMIGHSGRWIRFVSIALVLLLFP